MSSRTWRQSEGGNAALGWNAYLGNSKTETTSAVCAGGKKVNFLTALSQTQMSFAIFSREQQHMQKSARPKSEQIEAYKQ